MFLKTIGDANLLDTNELFVLKDAPDDTCLRLADTMVTYLLTDVDNEMKTLLTPSHVEWVMQIFGRTFQLPIHSKSERVISGAISLYKKWMYLPSAPPPIQKKSLYFTKKMCCHLSFVFENRNLPPNSSEFQVHVSLCQRVLGIYSKSARTPPPEISEVYWNEFLCRIFLGICDEVMRGPADSRTLGNDIEQDVFFCMFDIWLRSQMQNETLWNTLLSMASKEWIHRRWFIESWGQCCVALTRKLIHVLYSGDNGSDAVFVFWPVLGTNVISINAMLEGRGSMIAMTKYKNAATSVVNNHNYEVRQHRFGSRSLSQVQAADLMSSNTHNHTIANGTGGGGGNSNLLTVAIDKSTAEHKQSTPSSATISSGTSSPDRKGPLSMATYIQIEDNRLLIYLWNCMLNLLDMSAINDPECFGCGIAWISRMVDMFLGIKITCSQRRSGICSASGNSILDIFSHELFTAAVNMNGFEEARAIALGGLCRIFVNKCDTVFKSEYLLNFYHTLHELLRNPTCIEETAREQVILNGATLFACDFDGCRALITIFLPHIGIILRKPQKPRLRLAAITMLCSFISLEWHFYNVCSVKKKKKKDANANENANANANANATKQQLPKLREQLKKLISNIIYDAIQTETNEYNLQKLLWCCSVFLIISSKHISKQSLFSSSLVRTIWKHIEEEAGHWPCHVITTAFKALSHVIEHVVYLDGLRNDSVLNWRMFIEMCQYAKIHLEAGTQFDIDSRRMLSVACLKCCIIWLKNDPSLIATNEKVGKALRDVIRHAINLKKPNLFNNNNANTTSGGTSTAIDYDYTGNEPPPLWDTMSPAGAGTTKGGRGIGLGMGTGGGADSSSNALKDVYRVTDELARFFTNDLGAYYQYRKQSICNSPMHRYAEAYLTEAQIEDYILTSLQPQKWKSHDRIRYFSYKKNRIITLIEMPRSKHSESDIYNAYERRHMRKQEGKGGEDENVNSNIFERRRQRKASRRATTDKATNSHTKHYLQHLEPRHCDVMILIRDAYGKYAWEASCIFNDCDMVKEIEEICATTPNIIDNSRLGNNAERIRTIFGDTTRNDELARALSKSQSESLSKAHSTPYTSNSEEEKEGSVMTDYDKLAKNNLIPKNHAKSPAAYWSSPYIDANWRYAQAGSNLLSVLMKSSIESQRKREFTTTAAYSKYQRHPLKHGFYRNEIAIQNEFESESKNAQLDLDKAVPFGSEMNSFSESAPHELPIQDDAATFMHSRRLLSSLGFLRPNQASGVPRFLDILDDYNAISDESMTQYLAQLDEITALDRIAVSILFHNDSETQLSDLDMLSSPASTKSNHTQSFEYFLTSMANRVSIKSHVGYKANLCGTDCVEFPYYSDSISGELAYIVPSELKAKVSFERKKVLYLSTCIRIIWSESESKKNCPIWLSTKYMASESARHPNPETPIIYIRITAHSHGLYRVSINGESVLPYLLGQQSKITKQQQKKRKYRHRKQHTESATTEEESDILNENEESDQIRSVIGAAHTNTTSIPTTGFERVIIGPLVDGMIISESVLPDLVRNTIVNASNLITELMDDSLSLDAKEKRERLILQIATKFETFRTNHRDKYYQWFFQNPQDAPREDSDSVNRKKK